MKIEDPGHTYCLKNLNSSTFSILQFYKDEKIHGEYVEGTSCQEVVRAVIDRVEFLNKEQPWSGNDDIIMYARMMIAGFEARAITQKVRKGLLDIEKLPTGTDGHIQIGAPQS